MFILDLLESILKLGLPMAGLSWFLFFQLYHSGHVDRGANRKAIATQVKALRAGFKAKAKAKVKVEEEVSTKNKADIVYDKWMWFGSGFYGLAALWTFVIIEITDIFNFIFDFPGWSVLFSDGVISLIVDILVNQIQNLVSAFVWFAFWDADSIWLWVLIAYLGYWVGVEAARRESEIPVAGWIEKLRGFFNTLKD